MNEVAHQPDTLLRWMESLADPIRLRLLRLIEHREAGVGELCDALQLPQSTVSRHLKVLADQGWVRSHRRGAVNLYSAAMGEAQPAARRLWSVAREQTDHWPSAKQDQLRLQRRLKERGDSQAFFAGAAGQWDRLRAELYGHEFTTAAIASLLPADWTVADLGCGTGRITQHLARSVGRVIGVDNSAEMLKAARKRLADLPNVELRRGDLRDLPIDDASCDAAIMVLALTYVVDPTAAIGEMRRTLKPGGRAVIIDLLRHDRDDFRREMEHVWAGFELPEVQRMMQGAGLAQVRCLPLSPETNTKGPALFIATGSTN